jgi:alpha-D-ribose 1-methylphosphonate 5-triphosphate synthase subunit PhnG
LAAAIDAGLQDEPRHALLYERVIAPLEAEQRENRLQIARRAAATQVQFFSMETMRA